GKCKRLLPSLASAGRDPLLQGARVSERTSRLQRNPSLRRRDDAGLSRDAAVVLDAAVALEVENRLLAERGGIEIAVGDDQLVVLGLRLGDDLAVGRGDDAAGDQRVAVLDPPLRYSDHPARGLIRAGLHAQPIVEQPLLGPLTAALRVVGWRVVAEHDELDPLQAHDAVGLRPATVVADAHA